MADVLTVVIDGEEFDLTKELTLDQVAELEDIAGESWIAIDFNRMSILRRVIYFIRSKRDPNVTQEEIDKLPMDILLKEDEAAEQEKAADPPKRAAKRASKSAAS